MNTHTQICTHTHTHTHTCETALRKIQNDAERKCRRNQVEWISLKSFFYKKCLKFLNMNLHSHINTMLSLRAYLWLKYFVYAFILFLSRFRTEIWTSHFSDLREIGNLQRLPENNMEFSLNTAFIFSSLLSRCTYIFYFFSFVHGVEMHKNTLNGDFGER